MYFPVHFAKFLRTPFLQNTSSGCFSQMLVFRILNCEFKTRRRLEFENKYGALCGLLFDLEVTKGRTLSLPHTQLRLPRTQLTFSCSTLRIETGEKGVNSIQS